MTAAAKKDAVRLRMEISFVGPESALSDLSKAANFLFVLGHDTNGRSSKAVFHGPLAKRLRDDLTKALEGADLKTRRPAIEVSGEWGYAKEPRKKNGEIVNDAAGKPIHDRQFEAKSAATLLSGPTLELFRAQRAAARNMKAVAKLQDEMAAAEKAGDLATALAKAKEANAIVLPYLEQMTKRGGTTAAPGDEYQAAVAAATEGSTNESLSEAAPAPEPEAARPIPDTTETAPVVKAPAPAAKETEAAPAAKPAIPRPRIGGFARPRPVAQIAAAAEAARAEQATAQTAASPETADQSDAEAARIKATEATIQPQIDPEATAEARFAKAGMDFVDSTPEQAAHTPKKLPWPVTKEGLDAVAEIYTLSEPLEPSSPPTQPAKEPPPPPPTERPVPQPPSEAPRPAPPKRVGFPSLRR